MLYWESGGFWLLYKRFEKGIFKFPGVVDEAMELSMQQLQWLLSGLILRNKNRLKNANTRGFINTIFTFDYQNSL